MIDHNSKKIWILEDDNGCQFVHEQTLVDKYLIKFFRGISSFREELKSNVERPSLLIADLNLEDGNFMSFLNSDEANSIFKIPFIIVSSIDDADALRFCFAEGAIDFEHFTEYLSTFDIIIGGYKHKSIRLACHNDISRKDIDFFINKTREYIKVISKTK